MNYRFVYRWPKWARIILLGVLTVVWIIPIGLCLVTSWYLTCFFTLLYHGPKAARHVWRLIE